MADILSRSQTARLIAKRLDAALVEKICDASFGCRHLYLFFLGPLARAQLNKHPVQGALSQPGFTHCRSSCIKHCRHWHKCLEAHPTNITTVTLVVTFERCTSAGGSGRASMSLPGGMDIIQQGSRA
ncbi:hypothetical protein ABBQ32_005342 [Trebouxia sp. C0010 RCD-2024]